MGADEEREAPLNSRIARTRTEGVADDPTAAMYLREWADCVVRMHRPRALSLLSTELNSPGQAELIDQLTGNRFTRRTMCARFRSMRIDNLVLRGAIAESLWRWEERRERSAGPLAPPEPATTLDSPAWLAGIARCVVERDGEAVARVMATRPGTSASRRALASLGAEIEACTPRERGRFDAHPLTLRGALGEPFYLSRRAGAEAPTSAAATSAQR